MADMPDLSHLTPEERAIIEGVMMRQRQEEQREHEIMRCRGLPDPFPLFLNSFNPPTNANSFCYSSSFVLHVKF